MDRREILAVSGAAILALTSCATTGAYNGRSLESRIEDALASAQAACGADLAGDTKSHRQIFGLPACRENRLNDTYRTTMRYDREAGAAFRGEPGRCEATLKGLRVNALANMDVSNVMTRLGFLEQGVEHILVCHLSICNGVEHCSTDPTRRRFYRATDGLLVDWNNDHYNYPNISTFFVRRAGESEHCDNGESWNFCYPPGRSEDRGRKSE